MSEGAIIMKKGMLIFLTLLLWAALATAAWAETAPAGRHF